MTIPPPAAAGLDEFVETIRRRLDTRGYHCGPACETPVAGYPDGRGRVVTISEAHDDLAAGIGPIWLYPPAPPAVTPVVQIPVVAGRGVQISVVGPTSIIDLEQARRLRDLVIPLWPG